MQLFRVLSAAVLLASLGVAAVEARSLRSTTQPAEYPPSSYKGKQYVDSSGCIFIRTGSGPGVDWVPRVSRDRKHLCGHRPTFARAAPAEPAPVKHAAAKPRVITPEPVVTAKPKPVKKAVRKVAAKPVRQPMIPQVVQKPAATKPVPAKPRVKYVAAKPVPVAPHVKYVAPQKTAKAQPRTPSKTYRAVCKGTWASANPYIGHERHGLPVRCGPQAQAPAGEYVYAPKRVAAPMTTTAAPQYIAPAQPRRQAGPQPKTYQSVCHGTWASANPYIGHERHGLPVRCGPQAQASAGAYITPPAGAKAAYYTRAEARRMTSSRPSRAVAMAAQPVRAVEQAALVLPLHTVRKIPKGYRRAWKDNRLNPHRAHGTVEGKASMEMVWTNTVPRRLVVSSTWQDTRRRIVLRRMASGRMPKLVGIGR
ncbi:MAG: hypothetical protein CSA68_00775 [Rhodobacterales bacterium]|nr:MAG: hypothetical protein CSA68_00775 [Rhodobacterales bacterium]